MTDGQFLLVVYNVVAGESIKSNSLLVDCVIVPYDDLVCVSLQGPAQGAVPDVSGDFGGSSAGDGLSGSVRGNLLLR